MVFRRTSYYRAVLNTLSSLLKLPQFRPTIAFQGGDESHLFNDNRSFVTFEIESLFREIEKIESLAMSLLPLCDLPRFGNSPGCLDANSTIGRRCYSRRLCTSMDDLLHELLAIRVRPAISHMSHHSSIPKKVRPYMVSSKVKSISGGENAAIISIPGGNRYSGEMANAHSISAAVIELRRRIQATFFRRNPSLQRNADFILDTIVKNCFIISMRQCSDLLNSQQVDLQNHITKVEWAQYKAKKAADFVMDQYAPFLAECAMNILCPLNTCEEVRAVAINLTIRHALSVGRSNVVAAVAAAIKKKTEQVNVGDSLHKTGIAKTVRTDTEVWDVNRFRKVLTYIEKIRDDSGFWDEITINLDQKSHWPRWLAQNFILWCIDALICPDIHSSIHLIELLKLLPSLWSSIMPKRNFHCSFELSCGFSQLISSLLLVLKPKVVSFFALKLAEERLIDISIFSVM